MNAFLLVIPVLFLRYFLLGMLSKDALKRAAHFAPVQGGEKTAYWVYQVTTLVMLIGLFFFNVHIEARWFTIGLACYVLGLILYAASIVYYTVPNPNGFNQSGLYRISRNPMYVAFFMSILGCVILAESWMLLGALLLFQLSSHWIILSEERWCIERFGADYVAYMKQVRRYV